MEERERDCSASAAVIGRNLKIEDAVLKPSTYKFLSKSLDLGAEAPTLTQGE